MGCRLQLSLPCVRTGPVPRRIPRCGVSSVQSATYEPAPQPGQSSVQEVWHWATSQQDFSIMALSLTRSSCSLASRRTNAGVSRAPAGSPLHTYRPAAPVGVWTRPTPDRNEDWIKPSYIPTPVQEPTIRTPSREDQPLYAPAPEFRPAELPEQGKELPAAPKMPERRPDPIPAGNPKKEAPPGEADKKKEAPPSKPKEE